MAQEAEGRFAAGPGKSDHSWCTRARDGSIRRDHVSVPCGAGDPRDYGRRCSQPPFVFVPFRQQGPPSCVTPAVPGGPDRPAPLPGKRDRVEAWPRVPSTSGAETGSPAGRLSVLRTPRSLPDRGMDIHHQSGKGPPEGQACGLRCPRRLGQQWSTVTRCFLPGPFSAREHKSELASAPRDSAPTLSTLSLWRSPGPPGSVGT